ISKRLNSQDMTLTASGTLVGTASYIAPELLLDGVASQAMDTYAMGLIFVELLTGHKVFEADMMAKLLLLHIKKPVEIPAIINQTRLGEVLRKATMKDPRKRYQHADEMIVALRTAMAATDENLFCPRDNKQDRSMMATEVHTPVWGTSETPPRDTQLSQTIAVSPGEELDPGPTRLDRVVPFTAEVQRPAPSEETKTNKLNGTNEEGAVVRGTVSTDSVVYDTSEPFKPFMSMTLIGVGAAIVLAAVGLILIIGLSSRSTQSGSEVATTIDIADRYHAAEAGEAAARDVRLAARSSIPLLHRVDLKSRPNGAKVYFEGEFVGDSPLSWTVREDALPGELRFEKDGYRPKVHPIETTPDSTVSVILSPLPTARSKPKPSSAPPRRPTTTRPTVEPRPRPEPEKPAQSKQSVDDVLRLLPH
ncbi:MAG: protein kinase domain-containing protein, partial [Bradymonadaceae bacterium]